MGTLAPKRRSGSSAAAATYPRWMLLALYSEGDRTGSSSTVDTAETLASARASNGEPVTIYLRRAVAPAVSCICVLIPPLTKEGSTHDAVVAAHGDSVLIFFSSSRSYFVYNVGDHLSRPPSLSLLTKAVGSRDRLGRLDVSATDLVRRGEDGLVVAMLQIVRANDDAPTRKKAAELILFRQGEWTVVRPRITTVHEDDGTDLEALISSWATSAVGLVGNDGHLCRIDKDRGGVLLVNVFDDIPVLRHMWFPAEAATWRWRRSCCGWPSWRVCVSAASGAVKLVKIFPFRCSNCGSSEHASAIGTWTLNAKDVSWVLDTVVDSTELWELDKSFSVARVHLVNPVISDPAVHHDHDSAARTEEGDDQVAPKAKRRRRSHEGAQGLRKEFGCKNKPNSGFPIY